MCTVCGAARHRRRLRDHRRSCWSARCSAPARSSARRSTPGPRAPKAATAGRPSRPWPVLSGSASPTTSCSGCACTPPTAGRAAVMRSGARRRSAWPRCSSPRRCRRPLRSRRSSAAPAGAAAVLAAARRCPRRAAPGGALLAGQGRRLRGGRRVPRARRGGGHPRAGRASLRPLPERGARRATDHRHTESSAAQVSSRRPGGRTSVTASPSACPRQRVPCPPPQRPGHARHVPRSLRPTAQPPFPPRVAQTVAPGRRLPRRRDRRRALGGGQGRERDTPVRPRPRPDAPAGQARPELRARPRATTAPPRPPRPSTRAPSPARVGVSRRPRRERASSAKATRRRSAAKSADKPKETAKSAKPRSQGAREAREGRLRAGR